MRPARGGADGMLGWAVRTDFGDLVVDQAIVHIVPRRAQDEELLPLQLSQTFCRLDEDVRFELQGKLRDVFARLGREVIEDPEFKSPARRGPRLPGR